MHGKTGSRHTIYKWKKDPVALALLIHHCQRKPLNILEKLGLNVLGMIVS